MQIDFVIHGVPQGHQVWETQTDKYYESFYGKYEIYGKPKQVFVVEVRDNPGTRSSYYSLIRPQNVLAASGRPGSYFGMSVRVDGHYCTDVYSLYQLLELAYNQYCANKLIKINGESEQYTVEAFDPKDSNLTEAKRYVLSQIQSHLGAEFESLDDSFTKKNASAVEYYNLDDVNSEAFFNATRVNGKVVISRDYPTKDALIKSFRAKDKQQQDVKKSDDERIDALTKENSELKQYKESYITLKAEYSKVKEQADGLSTSLASEKGNVASLKQQVSSLSTQVEQMKKAANIQQIASKLESSMSEMLPILQAIAPKSRPTVAQPIDTHDDYSKRAPKREPYHDKRFYRIAFIILIVLLLSGIYFAIKGLKSGPEIKRLTTENKNLSVQCDMLEGQVNQLRRQVDESSRDNGSYESFFNAAFPNVAIDVEGYNGKGMEVGKTYDVSIKNYPGKGEWVLDGFTLAKGKTDNSSIRVIPSKSGQSFLNYKVGGVVVKSRAFTAN